MKQSPEKTTGAEVHSSAAHEQRVVLNGLTGFINAGGRGTRLSPIFTPGEKGVCKALLPMGKPPITFIEHQINKLVHAGVPTIVADVGDHHDAAEHVRTVYSDRSEVHAVSYLDSLESGGGLIRIIRDRSELFADSIFICCIDTLLDIDEAEFLAFHREKGGEISVALSTNKGVPNEGAYYVGHDDEVVYCGETKWHDISEDVAAERSAYRGSCTGAIIADTDFLKNIAWRPEDGPMSLYRGQQVIPPAIEKGSMFAFNNGERLFTDLGTVASWNAAQANYDTIAPHIHYAS